MREQEFEVNYRRIGSCCSHLVYFRPLLYSLFIFIEFRNYFCSTICMSMINLMNVCCLSSSGKYFMHLHVENKFNNTKENYTEMREEWVNRCNDFSLRHEKHRELGRDKSIKSSVEVTIRLLFGVFWGCFLFFCLFFCLFSVFGFFLLSVAPSKHVTNSEPQSDFPYYSLKTSFTQSRGHRLSII